MASATLLSLRERLSPPARRPAPRRSAPHAGLTPEAERLLRLASDIFGVATACLVLASPDGLAVEAPAVAEGWSAEVARDAACSLFEVLAAEPSEDGRRAGVLEEVVPGRGYVAATPVLSASGRCLGALCLMDAGRKTMLSGLQRRLFGEFGDLVAPALAGTAAPPAGPDTLRDLADRDPDAIALFDADGRCLLRNRRFDTLLGTASPSVATPEIPEALGCEEAWLARHLARDAAPVGVYRAALPDGTWLSVEERRSPHGRSLVARVEERDAFGGSGDMQLLFERCPLPMFVFDRDTRAILAVNEAALALYGWERDAFLRLDLDGLGAAGAAPAAGATEGWTHRTRDGRPLPVSGRTVGVDHRGRPAVLVTVVVEDGRERVA